MERYNTNLPNIISETLPLLAVVLPLNRFRFYVVFIQYYFIVKLNEIYVSFYSPHRYVLYLKPKYTITLLYILINT